MSAAVVPFAWDFELERKSITQTPTGDVIVEGYASTWDVDRTDEFFAPDAFQKGLRRFLSSNPQVLWMHDYKVPLGVVEDALIDSKGLFVRCRLDAPTPGSAAADVIRRVLRGSLRSFSVGGRWKREPTPTGVRITEADVMEVSIASVPVNPNALITSVARKSFENPNAELDRLLHDLQRLRHEVAVLSHDSKATGGTMDYATAAATYADPLGHMESQQRDWTPQERRRIAERARQEEIRRGEERPDGVTTHYAEVTTLDLIGRTPRNKYGELVSDDAHEAIRQHENVPASLSGDELNAMLGVPKYVDPGRLPEAIFAEEARKRRHEQWKQNLRDSFDAALRRTQGKA